MGIVEALEVVKKAIENLEIKATKGNCENITTAFFWLDKICETCNNVAKQKGGDPVDGESAKQNV